MPNAKQNPDVASDLYQQAQGAADRGDWEETIRLLEIIVAQNPRHAHACANLAWLSSQTGDYRSAVMYYLKLVRIRFWDLQTYGRFFQSGWFLFRRQMWKVSSKNSFIGILHKKIRSLWLWFAGFLTRIIECKKARNAPLSHYLHFYRCIVFSAGVNEIEYFKFTENKFVLDCLAERGTCRILDLASGRSSFPAYLAERGNEVVTAELDWTALRTQQALSALIPDNSMYFTAGNFLSLPFRDEVFDLITIISSIEHIPDDGDIRTMETISRIIKPGGELLITVPAGSIYAEQWTLHTIGHVYEECSAEGNRSGFLRVYDREALMKRLIEPSGLELISMRFLGETSPWGWLGLGRNFVDHHGVVHPSLFAAPLCLSLCRELQWEEVGTAHWAVACLRLRKSE